MRVSRYIQILEDLMKEHGNLEVETYSYGRKEARIPRIAYRKILKGRESKPDFHNSFDEENRKGEKVIKV